MIILYIEIAVILAIVFGSFAASHLEKRRKRHLLDSHPEFDTSKKLVRLLDISGSPEILNQVQNDINYEQFKEDIKQKSIFQFGRDQFKKLVSKNLSIPVTML